ncbi:MAG: hypothetical protein H7Y38_03570, partial [Armatimonadetes bacterium]|nr:hypothetical protein [Armatimonadota bacterium]
NFVFPMITPNADRYFPAVYRRGIEWVRRTDEWGELNRRWLTALHEAAHTVIAYRHGLTIEMMRLRKNPADNSDGYVMPATKHTALAYTKESIAMLLAGNIAVNIETRARVWHRAGRDEAKALQRIIELLNEGDEDFEGKKKKRRTRLSGRTATSATASRSAKCGNRATGA